MLISKVFVNAQSGLDLCGYDMNTFAAKGGVMILIGLILTLFTGSASISANDLNLRSDLVSVLRTDAGQVTSGSDAAFGHTVFSRPANLPPDFPFFFEEPETETDDSPDEQSVKSGDASSPFQVKLPTDRLSRFYSTFVPQHYLFPSSTSRTILFQVFRI